MQPDNASLQSEVAKCGYLFKYRPYKFTKTWDLRFFSLEQAVLQYFKSQKDMGEHPRGVVKVHVRPFYLAAIFFMIISFETKPPFHAPGLWLIGQHFHGFNNSDVLKHALLCKLRHAQAILEIMNQYATDHRSLQESAMTKHQDSVASRNPIAPVSVVFITSHICLRGVLLSWRARSEASIGHSALWTPQAST